MQPNEFWGLSPLEWWWEYDCKVAIQKRVTTGLGGVSVADWEDARKRHAEKMRLQNG